MARWRTQNFECPDCKWRGERLIDMNSTEPEVCGEEAPQLGFGLKCSGVLEKRMGAPLMQTIVEGNSDFAERQSKRLAERSSEHFKREGRDEAIERQRGEWRRQGILDRNPA